MPRDIYDTPQGLTLNSQTQLHGNAVAAAYSIRMQRALQRNLDDPFAPIGDVFARARNLIASPRSTELQHIRVLKVGLYDSLCGEML